MNVRRAAISASAAACLALTATACGASDAGQGSSKAKSAKTATAKKSAKKDDVDCGPDSTLSQQDWIDLCGKGQGLGSEADTARKVGESFKYQDGVMVTVTRIAPIPKSDLGGYAEYDETKPGDNPFRAFIKVTNASKKSIALDDFMADAEGATKGGAAGIYPVEHGMKEMAGRVAPGQTAEATGEFVLEGRYGTKVNVTIARNSETEMLAEDPHWTGSIR